jgi:LacI family transcriptional regulator
MAVGLKDVARAAGVSPITVSRALSGTHVVAPETKARVMRAVKKLGYAPNLLARGMVLKRSSTLGVVVPELANPFFVTLIDAIQTAVQERDHLLIVNQSRREVELETTCLKQFTQLRVAGVLAVPISKDLGSLEALAQAGTPVVVVARKSPSTDYVTVDNGLGGRLAAEHLLGLGHRRLGLVTLDEPGNTAMEERVQGFEKAVRDGGGTLAGSARIATPTVHLEEGLEAATRFAEIRPRPTGVFVTADLLAVGFEQGLRRHGLRVPEDVALVGHDDIVLAAYANVPLTTVQLPVTEMGRKAVELLFARLAEAAASDGEGSRKTRRAPPQRIALSPRLVTRASSGAPRTSS